MSYTGLKPSEVDLLVKKEFLSGYEKYQPVGPQIFNIESPTRLNEKESVVTTDGDIPQTADGAAYPASLVRELGTVTYTSVEYKRKWGITALMDDFSNYGTTMKMMRKAGYRARYKQDDLLAAVLSGGFATTTVWDGDFLFSATHNVGDTGTTQSNLASGALSQTSLTAAYIQLGLTKDHEGLTMPLEGAKLVVPRTLAPTAWELLKSPQGPETGNRKLNYVNSLNLELVVWPLLDAVSTTAWFLVADKMWHALTAYQKVAPSMKMYTDDDTDNMWEKIRFVQIQGATDFLGCVASTGA
jgi:hypothetical protein